MRTASTTLAISLFISFALLGSAEAEIQWQPNLKKAHAKAQSEGKLMLLHFVRDNCLYCDKLEEGAFQDPQVAATIEQGFAAVKINVSDSKLNRRIAERFNIDRFPMDVVVTPNGEALAHDASPQTPNGYIAMLTRTLPSRAANQTQIAAAQNRAKPQANEARSAKASLPVQIPSPDKLMAQVDQPVAGPTATANVVAPKNEQAAPTERSSVPNSPAVAKTVSARINPMPAAPPKVNGPELALEGFCSVTVVDEAKWVEGKPDFGVVHLGKLYLFNNAATMEKFLANPTPYTPILNEIDVVRFFEERVIVPGKREWSMQDPKNKRMFFFADQAAMLHFENAHARYVDAAINIMESAIKESNPQ